MVLASRGDRDTADARGRSTQLFQLGIVAVVAIWVAVVLISLFSPDSVSGSEQEHVPIAAILTWIWGLIATRSLVPTLVAQRDKPDRMHDVRILVGGVTGIWFVATLVAVFGPEIVTGSDPTRVPISAILAPIAAMVLTKMICQLFAMLHEDRQSRTSSG